MIEYEDWGSGRIAQLEQQDLERYQRDISRNSGYSYDDQTPNYVDEFQSKLSELLDMVHQLSSDLKRTTSSIENRSAPPTMNLQPVTFIDDVGSLIHSESESETTDEQPGEALMLNVLPDSKELLDFDDIKENHFSNSEAVLELEENKVSESGLQVLSIFCAHMASKWNNILELRPKQSKDMSVEVYYDLFFEWKKKLEDVSYIGGEESYIDDFLYGLELKLGMRVWCYEWKPHTLYGAFRSAVIEEIMMKHDADRVLAEMPHLNSIGIQGVTYVLDENVTVVFDDSGPLDIKLQLDLPTDSNSSQYGKWDQYCKGDALEIMFGEIVVFMFDPGIGSVFDERFQFILDAQMVEQIIKGSASSLSVIHSTIVFGNRHFVIAFDHFHTTNSGRHSISPWIAHIVAHGENYIVVVLGQRVLKKDDSIVIDEMPPTLQIDAKNEQLMATYTRGTSTAGLQGMNGMLMFIFDPGINSLPPLGCASLKSSEMPSSSAVVMWLAKVLLCFNLDGCCLFYMGCDYSEFKANQEDFCLDKIISILRDKAILQKLNIWISPLGGVILLTNHILSRNGLLDIDSVDGLHVDKVSLGTFPYMLNIANDEVFVLFSNLSSYITQASGYKGVVLRVSFSNFPSMARMESNPQVFDLGKLFEQEEYESQLHCIGSEPFLIYSHVYGEFNALKHLVIEFCCCFFQKAWSRNNKSDWVFSMRNGREVLSRSCSVLLWRCKRPFVDFHGALAQLCSNFDQAAQMLSIKHDKGAEIANIYYTAANMFNLGVYFGDKKYFIVFCNLCMLMSTSHVIISLLPHKDSFSKTLFVEANSKLVSTLLCCWTLSLDIRINELELVTCFGSWIGLLSPMRANFAWDPGICAIFVYILEDKDAFKRMGNRIQEMVLIRVGQRKMNMKKERNMLQVLFEDLLSPEATRLETLFTVDLWIYKEMFGCEFFEFSGGAVNYNEHNPLWKKFMDAIILFLDGIEIFRCVLSMDVGLPVYISAARYAHYELSNHLSFKDGFNGVFSAEVSSNHPHMKTIPREVAFITAVTDARRPVYYALIGLFQDGNLLVQLAISQDLHLGSVFVMLRISAWLHNWNCHWHGAITYVKMMVTRTKLIGGDLLKLPNRCYGLISFSHLTLLHMVLLTGSLPTKWCYIGDFGMAFRHSLSFRPP